MKNMFNLTKPEFHRKGWGYELWLTNNDKYCGKILHFNAGKRCSFHYHKLKHEHFYVLKGLLQIDLAEDDDMILSGKSKCQRLYAGEILEIPTELRHQIIALMESELFEISTQHFEDDSYRVILGD